MIYLDHNASAPMPDAVKAAMVETFDIDGNPSSVHGAGRAVRAVVELARERVAALVGAAVENVIFTSGATEANHLAIKGEGRRRVIVSAVEHPSVLAAAPDADILPVDRSGCVDPETLRHMLASDAVPALVSVMLANNETGVVQPIAALAEAAHEAGALLHCDAVQAPGRIGFSLDALGVDLLTLSAHKLGGPKGVGALILNGDIGLDAQMPGGGQERGRRGGTENVSGIAGFGCAAELARDNLALAGAMAGLRDDLEARLAAAVPDVSIHGASAARLPNTSCIGLSGVPAETQVIAMDLAGIAISAGSACSSGKVTPSHVLEAMGLSADAARSAIRISIGIDTTEDDLAHFLDAWIGHIKLVRERESAA
jgi:cysteine desulfurase